MSNQSSSATPPTDSANTHVVILLDRSGSMSAIATDVIGGVNQLIKEQRENGSDARMTLIQFDSQDPQEVVVWGAPVAEIVDLNGSTFQPRGSTPLLDATGLAIGRTMVDQQARLATGLPKEDIIFVTVTDGEENCSREYTLKQVRELVESRTTEGWSFIYLSAGLDAYHDAAQMGFTVGNTMAFSADGANTGVMFKTASRGLRELRDKKRRGVHESEMDFFASGKDAETERDK